jgi:hypothetical protein
MMATIASSLDELANVGNVPVTLVLNGQLFTVDAAREAVARHEPTLSLRGMELTVGTGHDEAWRALREFTQDLLAAAQQVE